MHTNMQNSKFLFTGFHLWLDHPFKTPHPSVILIKNECTLTEFYGI